METQQQEKVAEVVQTPKGNYLVRTENDRYYFTDWSGRVYRGSTRGEWEHITSTTKPHRPPENLLTVINNNTKTVNIIFRKDGYFFKKVSILPQEYAHTTILPMCKKQDFVKENRIYNVQKIREGENAGMFRGEIDISNIVTDNEGESGGL